jgi:predicted Zn-dependent peptidase
VKPQSVSRALRAVLPVLAGLVVGACATPKPPPPPPPPAPEAQAAPPVAEAPAVDRSQPPPLGPNPPLTLPAQRHFTLQNGLRVRVVEQHRLPTVALDLVVDAGAARDPAGLAGLASFTADMLTEGTRTRSATQISDQVGFLGASLEASAGPDAATLSGGCLSDKLPAFLEIFADVARNASFPNADFRRVQDARKVTLLQQRDQPPMLASRAFVSLFWGDHPYGHPLLGTEAALARTKREDLVRFHDRFWRPANAELVVVGDVTEAGIRPLLERTLGTWPSGRAAAPLSPRGPVAPHRTLVIDKPGASQAYLTLGAPGLDRRSDDYAAATVMFEVLGGGTSSRLFRTLREEKGYTYGIGAGADARRLAGASVVRGSVKAEVTGAALQDLLAQLALMRDQPVSAEELAEARDGIVRSLPARFATVGGVAGQLSALATYGLPDDYWTEYAKAVQQVTAADVQRMAQRYLAPDRLTLVLVGAKALVVPQLASVPLGAVQVERVTNPPLPRKPSRRPAAGQGQDAGAGVGVVQ